jgi:hypothetical protein
MNKPRKHRANAPADVREEGFKLVVHVAECDVRVKRLRIRSGWSDGVSPLGERFKMFKL